MIQDSAARSTMAVAAVVVAACLTVPSVAHAAPTPAPTATPSAAPTATPSAAPTATLSAAPSAASAPSTAAPTAQPTGMQSATTAAPSPAATTQASAAPSAAGSPSPSVGASSVPRSEYTYDLPELPRSLISEGRLPADHAPAAPQTGALPFGMRYIMQPMTNNTVTAIQLWYRAPSTGFSSFGMPSIAQFAATAVAASPMSGLGTLSRMVQVEGGQFTIEVFPDATKIAALVPVTAAPKIINAFSRAYFTPTITTDGYKRAAYDLTTQALLGRIDAVNVMNDGVFSALFAGGPAAVPQLEQQSLTKLTLPQLQAYAVRAYRADNALLVVTGGVTPELLTAVQKPERSGDGPEKAVDSPLADPPQNKVTQSMTPGIGFGWAGSKITDDSAATALDFIGDYLFNEHDGIMVGRIAKSAPDVQILGQYITLRNPGVFMVAVAGTGAEGLRPDIEAAITAMSKPLDEKTFAVAREAFIAHLESTADTPDGLAASLGWYDIEGNATYAPGLLGESGTYFRDAWSLTPEAVAETARKYLHQPAAVVRLVPMLARKTSSQ